MQIKPHSLILCGTLLLTIAALAAADFEMPKLTKEERKAIVEESRQAIRKRAEMPNPTGSDLPKEILGPTILKLNPIRVRTDHLNVSIVLNENADFEEGFYIKNPVSSFAYPAAGPNSPMAIYENLSKWEESFGSVYHYKLKKNFVPSPPARVPPRARTLRPLEFR